MPCCGFAIGGHQTSNSEEPVCDGALLGRGRNLIRRRLAARDKIWLRSADRATDRPVGLVALGLRRSIVEDELAIHGS